jgi:hypothetical protein
MVTAEESVKETTTRSHFQGKDGRHLNEAMKRPDNRIIRFAVDPKHYTTTSKKLFRSEKRETAMKDPKALRR